jgi:hypothetical protein
MEDLWRLRPSLFLGVGYCLEEGAHYLAGGLVLLQICWFMVEEAHNRLIVCKGFFIGPRRR